MLAGAARGALGAMAMSGMRQATTSLGLVARTPPESVLTHATPDLFGRVPPARRAAMVEAVHWAYGATGGMLFGFLPRPLRRSSWAGPVYGTLFWLAFELAIKGPLGIDRRHGGVSQKAALFADHLLYGVTVSASEWPYRD